MCCKHLLGVHKNTTTDGVLLELGRLPLLLFAQKAAIKNWERIRKNKCNPLLSLSYKRAVKDVAENSCLWLSNIKRTLEHNGMLSHYLNQYVNEPLFIYKKIFQTLSDQFHQNTFQSINSEVSKLRTYAIFKTKIGFEGYLSEIKEYKIRTQVSKLRLSDHTLLIETGRHKKIPKEMRVCPFCPKLVENEFHFLLICPTYTIIRDRLLNILGEKDPIFKLYSLDEKFKYIMTNIDRDIAQYVSECFKIRTIMVSAQGGWGGD